MNTVTEDVACPDSPRYQSMAFVMVLVSGVILLRLGLVVQAVCWDFPDWIAQKQVTLHPATERFINHFCRRPTEYAGQIVLWTWWPMVLAWVHCYFRFGSSPEFGLRFLYLFVMCWLIVGVVCTMFAGWAAWSRVLTLSELEQPPEYMRVINYVSLILPACAAAFIAYHCISKSDLKRSR